VSSPRLFAAGAYVDAVRAFNRNVVLLLSVTAARGMTIAATGAVFNLYLHALGFGTPYIGLVNATNALATLVVSVPLGYLADRIGRRPVLLLGGTLYPFLFLAVTLTRSPAAILVLSFLFGGAATAYWVAGVPLLYSSAGERERVHAFSINSFLLWGIGPLGALLAGLVVEAAGHLLGVSPSAPDALRFGLFFGVLVSLLGAVPYPFLEERGEHVHHETAPPIRQLAGLFIRLLAPDLLLAIGLGGLVTFIQLYYALRFHLDAGPIGVILAVGGVTAGVGTLFTPSIAARFGRLRTAVWLQWSTVPFMVVLAASMLLPPSILAYWLLVTLRGMSDPVYTTFVQERVSDRYRARLTGLYSVTYSIGFSFGPATSGELQQVGGFTAAFIVAAAVYFVGSSLLWLFFRKRPDSEAAGVQREGWS